MCHEDGVNRLRVIHAGADDRAGVIAEIIVAFSGWGAEPGVPEVYTATALISVEVARDHGYVKRPGFHQLQCIVKGYDLHDSKLLSGHLYKRTWLPKTPPAGLPAFQISEKTSPGGCGCRQRVTGSSCTKGMLSGNFIHLMACILE